MKGYSTLNKRVRLAHRRDVCKKSSIVRLSIFRAIVRHCLEVGVMTKLV